MNCYKCGCLLTENDFCTNCGAEVDRFKRIVRLSNQFYNFGLEKAQVRDLSGAIVCLKQSLKMNKNNIEARNLLGLVYLEIGEAVSALNEWVISKNIQPKKNIADDYLDMMQANPARLDALNQAIKKYNQALTYCRQDSLDLAMIQLKKVLSINPKYVQAHQLLALLYMNVEEWERARQELHKALRVDTNNTITLRYLRIVDSVTNVDSELTGSAGKRKKKHTEEQYGDEIAATNRKNREAVLNNVNVKEPNGLSVLLNVVIGCVIGVAISWFLILPARINQVRSDHQKIEDGYIATLSEKNDTIKQLTEEKEELVGKIGELEYSLNGYSGTDEMVNAYERLTYAEYLYLDPDHTELEVAEALNQIQDSDYLNGTENYKAAYDHLLTAIGPAASRAYYNQGMVRFDAGDYEGAIPDLQMAVKYDAANVDALYDLGNAYRLNENREEAIAAYEKLIELFPNSSRVSRAKRYLKNYED